MPNNAVIYARYSSHNQTEQSIEGQLADAYDYAARENYRIIGEYIDRAQTGTTDARADFQRMINDAQKKQFQTVIVWKLDRFARNRYDSAIYKSKLKKLGVRVVSVKEAISDNPEGIILEGMLEAMAEYYSANLSVNVKRGIRESMKKGLFIGGHIPYGYRLVDRRLEIDDKTAPVICEFFTRYADGERKADIARDMSARGILSPTGYKLNSTTFDRALNNPVYCGRYEYNGEIMTDYAPPIITPELFDRVKKRLASNKAAPARYKAKDNYVLQGKLFCGECGASMNGECGRSGSGAYYYYYSCNNRKNHSTCTKKPEKKSVIEDYVIKTTVSYILAPSNMDKIALAVAAEYEKEFNDNGIRSLERKKAKAEADVNTLVDTLTEIPKAARARVYEKIELLEASVKDITEDIRKLTAAAGIKYTPEEIKAWLATFARGDIDDPDFRRRVVDTFINSIYVYDDRIVIFYNIRNNNKLSHETVKQALASSNCSDLTSLAPPSTIKSEHFIFTNGVFGFVFLRQHG